VAVKVFLDQHVKAEAIEEFKAEVCLSYPPCQLHLHMCGHVQIVAL